jgi:hypothetical protein
MFFLNWLYTDSSLGGLTGGEYSLEDPEDTNEETKEERQEDYEQLYDEQMNLNHSLLFP